MYPGAYAELDPGRIAHVMAISGEAVTYGELEARSRQLAQLWWAQGLRPGDHVAVLLENHVRFPEVFWASMRSGLYLTTVNRYLAGEEAAYIVNDCGARALVTSWALRQQASALVELSPNLGSRLMIDGTIDGYASFEQTLAMHPAERLDDEPLGETMLYSSGTTGRPKGVKRPLPGLRVDDGDPGVEFLLRRLFGFSEATVYLSPAPMYHSAPLGFSMGTQSLGGTVVIMERFDALDALAAIERHHVTHSQWVPTMFVRLLKLARSERERFDLSSHEMAIHAAAPCPIAVKRQMIEWWGPILHEYYGGTEFNGLTYLNSQEWLSHEGSVGKAVFGTLHICDEDGKELPAGDTGHVYFELPALPFEYHNDPDKTARAKHPEHDNWSALGDIGYVDGDGYLYLSDRATFMIISGGVNIYPQEIENLLLTHPRVMDVAVVGVPNAEFGEEVKAVVQPLEWEDAKDELAAELDDFCRLHLAHYKCPRSYDFDRELPRLPTGKLFKQQVKDRYWATGASRIL